MYYLRQGWEQGSNQTTGSTLQQDWELGSDQMNRHYLGARLGAGLGPDSVSTCVFGELGSDPMCLYWGALLEPECTCGGRERGSTWSGTADRERCSVYIGELGSDPDTEKNNKNCGKSV
jgi:hypothetical protein